MHDSDEAAGVVGVTPVKFVNFLGKLNKPSPELLGAVARGYCHKENIGKVLDPKLCVAIAEEVCKLISHTPQPAIMPNHPSPEEVLAAAGVVVKKLTPQPGDVVVLRVSKDVPLAEWRPFQKDWAKRFPAGAVLGIMTDEADLSQLGEDAMRRAGWMRTSHVVTLPAVTAVRDENTIVADQECLEACPAPDEPEPPVNPFDPDAPKTPLEQVGCA